MKGESSLRSPSGCLNELVHIAMVNNLWTPPVPDLIVCAPQIKESLSQEGNIHISANKITQLVQR